MRQKPWSGQQYKSGVQLPWLSCPGRGISPTLAILSQGPHTWQPSLESGGECTYLLGRTLQGPRLEEERASKPFPPLPLELGERPPQPLRSSCFILRRAWSSPSGRVFPVHTSATWLREIKRNQEAPSGRRRMQAGPGMVGRPAWAEAESLESKPQQSQKPRCPASAW